MEISFPWDFGEFLDFSHICLYAKYLGINKGRVPKLKSAKVWSLTIEGGEGVTQNQIFIETSFYSVNLAISSENL